MRRFILIALFVSLPSLSIAQDCKNGTCPLKKVVKEVVSAPIEIARAIAPQPIIYPQVQPTAVLQSPPAVPCCFSHSHPMRHRLFRFR